MPERGLPDGVPCVCESFVGRLGIWFAKDVVLRTAFIAEEQVCRPPGTGPEKDVVAQLARYFKDPGCRLSGLPLIPARASLQGALRRFLQATRAGELMTYATAARLLGTGARAVGRACSTNPYPVLVPCHRIIAADGLGGYTGLGDVRANLWIKRRLIEHESVIAMHNPNVI